MGSLRFAYTNHLEQFYAVLLNGPPVIEGAVLNCVSGVNTITRAAGSFITDGVKLQALLSGTIAARFPGGTRVIGPISALSVTMSANATSSTVGAEAGTFSPTQNLTEDPSFPTTNLLDADRYTEWDTSAGFGYPGSILLEFDLGASRLVTLGMAQGIKSSSPATGGLDVISVDSATTYGTWTNRMSFAPATVYSRDANQIISVINARYWRISFTLSKRCRIGGFYLGNIDQDLGFSFPPGTNIRRIYPSSILRSPGRVPVVHRLGDEMRSWEIPYPTLTTAQRQKIQAAYENFGISLPSGLSLRRTPVFIDEDDIAWEADMYDDDGIAFEFQRRFVGVDTETLRLISLP